LENNFIRVKYSAMAEEKKCMVCGKAVALKGGICDPCQDRIRREALGQQAGERGQAETELKNHGVNPESGRKKN
jgi:hypothetical protein